MKPHSLTDKCVDTFWITVFGTFGVLSGLRLDAVFGDILRWLF